MSKKYDPAIDALRLISILAVVMIHTTTRELELSHFNLLKEGSTLFLNQASRFAVPLFFTISGFVLELSHKKISYVEFLKKRSTKIFIPYFFWSAVYYLFIYTKNRGSFINAILTGSASYQLYFIPSLFIFYLLFPLLHKNYKTISNKFIYLALFVTQVLILNYDYHYHTSNFPYPISVVFFNYFCFISGMIIARNKEKVITFMKRFWFPLASALLLLSYLIFTEGEKNYFVSYNYLSFYSQWRPSVLVYTFAVFAILYYLFAQKIKNQKLINTLASLSFFVFFIHVIIIELIGKYVEANNIVFFVSVSCVSFLIAYLVHKLKPAIIFTG